MNMICVSNEMVAPMASRRSPVRALVRTIMSSAPTKRPKYQQNVPGQTIQKWVAQASSGYSSTPDFDPEVEQLRSTARLQKSLCYVSFWLQLALSLVSALVLGFSVVVSPPGSSAVTVSKWLTLVGVVFAFLSAFFAHGFMALADKLLRGDAVRRSWIVSNLINVNNMNLVGIGATIVGLQASVGTLVSKTFMTSIQSAVVTQSGNALIPLDMYALQASTNTLLSHFISLIFTNILLRLINKK